MYTLRPYQEEARLAGVDVFRRGEREVFVEPTGSGKSLVIASVAKELEGNTIVFQPNKEILEQNLQKMKDFGVTDIGVFSASMGEKTLGKITLATIGTIYNQAHLWGHFKNVIIDECHLVNPDSGRYKDFILAHDGAVLGLTATAWRQHQYTDGYGENYVVAKFLHRTRPKIFKKIAHITQIGEMYRLGYLAPVRYTINDAYDHGKIKLNSTGADFDEKALRTYNEEMGIVELVAKQIKDLNSKHILVFNVFVKEAEELGEQLRNAGITAQTISAKTPKKERTQILADFKSGKIKVITNVGVLTTGFDFPELDCVVLARPTQSVGLYYQMIGRGVRTAVGKEYVQVIDVCGNVPRFGKIEEFEIVTKEGKPNLHRLQSDVSFLTGFDVVHELDAEETDFKGLSKAVNSKQREEARKKRIEADKAMLGDNILSFGKHEGKHISEVDTGYIDWVIENFDNGAKRDLFVQERQRRASLLV